jgi:uncharacterized protein
MSLNLTYPGVYVQELPSAVRTIIGVSTSITAFIGRAKRGPVDRAVMIHNFSDYVRTFGALSEESKMSYAVYQYFLNGGKDAYIIRAFPSDATFATYNGSLPLQASSPGVWGNDLEITVNTTDIHTETRTADPSSFNLEVKLIDNASRDKPVISKELHRNISTDNTKNQYIAKVLELESDLIRIQPNAQVPAGLPPGGKLNRSNDGNDGSPLTSNDIVDLNKPKSGLYLLENVDLFNMLCIPPYNDDDNTEDSVYADALDYCKKRRAMLIVDPPVSWRDKDIPTRDIQSGAFALERHQNAAIWFPRIKAPDPLDQNRIKEYVPCGVVAGVIARTDNDRGVWKAPAGIEATLAGIADLVVTLTNEENGELNPQGINCLRFFPEVGRVIWGARTWRGADVLTDQWKYLPVRRTALFIEESLYRGTQWVVFEPNDERLWAQIRLNVGAFMHDLFRKGAFQGTDPKKAYLVKCDSETTTQDDIDKGIVNILVGFAPLKPAEFVILQIQQLTHREETVT